MTPKRHLKSGHGNGSGRATQSTAPPAGLMRAARGFAKPENFYVGLSDRPRPMPRNILMFCNLSLAPLPKDNVHYRFMLVLNLQTEASMLIDSRMLNLAPGQALLIFPFQTHRYLERKSMATWFFITFEMTPSDLLRDLRNRPVDILADGWTLVDALMHEYRQTQNEEAMDGVCEILTALLVRLQRRVRYQPVVTWEPHPGMPAHRIVQRACLAIEKMVTRHFSISDLADDIHVSGGHLRACFQEVLGFPVTTYIRRTRVYMACRMLSRTESAIGEIAERCGFGSIYAFSRAFKREVGTPPKQYRAHLWETRNRLPSQ